MIPPSIRTLVGTLEKIHELCGTAKQIDEAAKQPADTKVFRKTGTNGS